MTISRATLQAIRDRNLKKNGKMKKLKKSPLWLFPKSIERQYIAYFWEYTFEIRQQVNKIIMPQLPYLLAQSTANYPDPQEQRLDGVVDEINRLIRITAESLVRGANILKLRSLEIAEEIIRYNTNQFQKITNSVLGIDIFLDRPWLREQVELFANQNAQLIDSLTEDELNRVSGAMQRGFQQGDRFETIAVEIQQSFGITRRHARLIARDQTAKLNASLTKLQQQETGANTFIWLTSLDERVRPSHIVMQDKICRWDDPTVYLDEKTNKWVKRSTIGGTISNPGSDVLCRCVSGFRLEGVFEPSQAEGNTTL